MSWLSSKSFMQSHESAKSFTLLNKILHIATINFFYDLIQWLTLSNLKILTE